MEFYLNNGKMLDKNKDEVLKLKKTILITTLLCSLIASKEIEYQGEISSEFIVMQHDLDKTRDKEIALRLDIKAKYQIDEDKKVVARVQGIGDIGDEERRYIDVSELYFEHRFPNSAFLIGKNIRSWEAMEFYNHTDNFNTKNWLDDPFDFDSKLGALNFSYNYFLDDASLCVIAKLYENGQKVQDERSSNRFAPLKYSNALETSQDRSSPTLYLKYTPKAKDNIDYSLILEHGYDEQRYLVPVNRRDINGSLKQHSYIVDKLMGYGTLKRGNTIYKSELALTYSEDSNVAHYSQASLGAEHTLHKFYKEMDIGGLVEYYKYKAFQKDKYNAKSFNKLFDDDLVLGMRVSQNDKYNSELLTGVMIDRHNSEKVYFAEYDTQINDKYKIGVDLQHLAPHKGSFFRDVDRIRVELGYYF